MSLAFLEKVSLNSCAFPHGSSTHSLFLLRSAGILQDFPGCPVSSLDFDHQAFEPRCIPAKSTRTREMYASCSARIPALHASAARISDAVPRAACLARTSSTVRSFSQGCDDFFSTIFFLGINRSDSVMMSAVILSAAALVSIVAIYSQQASPSTSFKPSQSAFLNCQTSRSTSLCLGTLNLRVVSTNL